MNQQRRTNLLLNLQNQLNLEREGTTESQHCLHINWCLVIQAIGHWPESFHKCTKTNILSSLFTAGSCSRSTELFRRASKFSVKITCSSAPPAARSGSTMPSSSKRLIRTTSSTWGTRSFRWQPYQGILKGEVSLYSWPPVWLVWNLLHDNWQFLFLFAKRTGQQYSDTPLVFPGLTMDHSNVTDMKGNNSFRHNWSQLLNMAIRNITTNRIMD